MYVEPRYRKKLEAKAVEGVFLVYAANSNAYVAAVPNNQGRMRLVQTLSITFDERQPFFKEPADKFDHVESGDRDDSWGYDSDDDGADGVAEPLVLPGPILPFADEDGGTMVQGVNDVQPAVLQIIESEEPVQRPLELLEQSTTRCGRVRLKPAWMEDYVLNDNFNKEAHLCIAAVVPSTDVPTSIQEALDDPNWKAALKAEFDSLVDNKNKELVPKAANRKIISGKWHFVVKQGSDGEILKYKGITQIFGMDYNRSTPQTCGLHLCNFMGNRSAAEVFGVPDRHQDGVLECTNE